MTVLSEQSAILGDNLVGCTSGVVEHRAGSHLRFDDCKSPTKIEDTLVC